MLQGMCTQDIVTYSMYVYYFDAILYGPTNNETLKRSHFKLLQCYILYSATLLYSTSMVYSEGRLRAGMVVVGR